MNAGITTTVKTALNEACLQILSPQRRVDILRDAMDAKKARRPFCITFCGVNGVGKSTNLAKVCVCLRYMWLCFLTFFYLWFSIDFEISKSLMTQTIIFCFASVGSICAFCTFVLTYIFILL